MNNLEIIPASLPDERNRVSEINDLHNKVALQSQYCGAAMQQALFCAWQAGLLLKDQQAVIRRQLGHGQWECWLRANFKGSTRNAQRYIWLAKNVTSASQLTGLSLRQAYRKLGMAKKGETPFEGKRIPAAAEHIRIKNRFLKWSGPTGKPLQLSNETRGILRRDLKPIYEWLVSLYQG